MLAYFSSSLGPPHELLALTEIIYMSDCEEQKKMAVSEPEAGDAGSTVADAAKCVGTAVKDVAKDTANSCLFQILYGILPFLGIVWFRNGKKLMGVLHLLICCVGAPICAYACFAGRTPFAKLMGMVYAIASLWVVGAILTFIGFIVCKRKIKAREKAKSESKPAKSKKVTIIYHIICAVLAAILLALYASI